MIRGTDSETKERWITLGKDEHGIPLVILEQCMNFLPVVSVLTDVGVCVKITP
jgi:hypothetical protein